MKQIFYALTLLIVCNTSLAQNKDQKHLSYSEYMYEFGTDSTSIAIIDLFFNKRNLSGIGQMSFLPVSSSVAIVIPPIGLAIMAISTPLFINGLLVRHKYSHKNLLTALEYYKNNNQLSERFKKQVNRILNDKRLNNIELINTDNYLALKEINKGSNFILIVE
jgi:hypothetical protein